MPATDPFALQLHHLLALAVLVSVTVYTELKDGKIYNWLTYPFLALALVLAFLAGDGGLLVAPWIVIACGGLCGLAFADGDELVWVCLIASVVGLVASYLVGPAAVRWALWGALAGGGIFFIPHLISGIGRGLAVVGGGDVKLAAVAGALMGPREILDVVAHSLVIGLVLAVGYVLHARFRSRRPDQQKEAPPLLTMRIPFGTAICAAIMLKVAGNLAG